MERVELQIAVDAGLSIRQLAKRFGCSNGSVRYWLAKYDLRTKHKSRRDSSPAVLAARAAELTTPLLDCPTHGRTQFVVDQNGTFRCRACRVSDVVRRRRRVKQLLVQEAGGRCHLCGYDRYQGALEFHHVEPGQKLFALSSQGLSRSMEAMRAEARKCVLLCSNCHAEVEGGLAEVSLH